MLAYERFMNYIHCNTASNEASPYCPSTEGQRMLAMALVDELQAMGIMNAEMDENGYVYAVIPATDPAMPSIGLIAHMDTVDCVPVEPIQVRVIEQYDGSDITLDNGDILSPKEYPLLYNRVGKDLIVTDGRTLLGADDKAGIAEIMTALEWLPTTGLPHGQISIAFTPDEEIGRGADLFNVSRFGADYAYTVDGDEIGGIEFENFNAASMTLTFTGRSVHPGSAKNVMINSALLAMEFNSMLPAWERPEHTEGYEGFYHLTDINGSIEQTVARYIIRDHDKAQFEAKKALAARIAEQMNLKYPGCVQCEITDSYLNMREIIEPRMDIVHRAEQAFLSVGVQPFSKPIRGGTDGSRLSFMGLPCPNLSTGGMNYHSRFECIAVQDMDIMVNMLIALLTLREA